MSKDLPEYRAQYLARIKSQLLGTDLSSAGATDLVMQSALLRAHSLVSSLDLQDIDYLRDMNGAALENYLQQAGNRARFEQQLASAGVMPSIVSSAVIMAAVADSPTAMASVAGSAPAMTAIVGNAPITNLLVGNATA
ncbi:hypothetical protein, partial [Chromobacterium piscinae]